MAVRNGGPAQRDRPIGELLKDLSEEISTLVRQEIDLARSEMTEKGRQAGMAGGLFGGAVVFGLLALGALSATAIAALDTAMPLWLAALIVAAVEVAAAAGLAMAGRARIKGATPPVPQQAQQSVKEDMTWVRNKARSART
jgi:hypothetical protein